MFSKLFFDSTKSYDCDNVVSKDDLHIRPLEEKNSLMTNTVQDLPVTLEEVYQRLYQSMIIRNVTFSFQHIFHLIS